jgi:NAD(P)-dependent dehydrogenase (short-subunit alcohol dehydrogenase family)
MPSAHWPITTAMELDRLNPVTLITGAASGLGAACASLLSRRSEGGLILVDGDEAALERTADSLSRPPERVSTLAFDVSDPDRWAQAASFIQGQYGRLDWAVVSTPNPAPLADTDLVDWRRGISAELDGVIPTLRALMPLMRANAQGGSIAVAAPATALTAEPGANGQTGAKAGLLQIIRAAAKEGAPERVRVNAIAPGGVETPMWATMPWFQDLVKEKGSEQAAFLAMAKMATPLARYAAEDDVSRLIMLLLSDASPITGATLVVDGGYLI